MIAEFTENGHRYGLTTEEPKAHYGHYRIVFSLYNGGTRSSCIGIDCSTCPFFNPGSGYICAHDTYHYLPKFGITRESHPELFI